MTGEYEFHYGRFPALKAYIDRIEAEQLNFRRFVVKEYRDHEQRRGYYELKATIKIVDGEVSCDNAEYDATEAEKAAIKSELAKVEWPHSIHAGLPQIDELLASGQIKGTLYIFLDQSRKEVIMCQERREKQDGLGKYYIPWTLFKAKGGGATWKEMEPDGDVLPFWKPKARRKKARIMIHEGAKAAKFCDDLVNDPECKNELRDHPWGEELSAYEHWGASGGALAIHRSDMEELRRMVKTDEGITLVYACDHDDPGEQAAQLFSKAWADRLVALRWDERFRIAWDLADSVPEPARHVAMWSFAEPATWATKKVGETSHGRPLYGLNKPFAKEWVHVVKPELYISEEFPLSMYSQKEFDHRCASFADKGVRVSELLKAYLPGEVSTINYRPDLKTGRHTTVDGAKFFNTYCPRRWEPYKKAPDVSLWLDFLTRLFPNPEELREIMRYAATLIAKPEIKMAYGLLLISEMQGVGKTTLADILAMILGPSNISYVEEHDITGRFNDWAEKRLIICEEIYAGHSAAAYNRLKSVATNKTVRIEKKNLQRYEIDNFGHVIACSNSIKALKLDNTDRRWMVPEVTEHKQSSEYWTGLHSWLDRDEGYRKIAWWAGDFLESERPVMPGEEAPWTATKSAVIEAFRSERIEIVGGILIAMKRIFETKGELEMKIEVKAGGQIEKLIKMAKQQRPCLFFDVDVVEAIKYRFLNGRSDDRLEKPLAIRKLAKELGFKVADREHRMRLINWRQAVAHGISIDQDMANLATELLKDKDPHSDKKEDKVEELICFSELVLELLGPVQM